jgi:hypothetical protein
MSRQVNLNVTLNFQTVSQGIVRVRRRPWWYGSIRRCHAPDSRLAAQ